MPPQPLDISLSWDGDGNLLDSPHEQLICGMEALMRGWATTFEDFWGIESLNGPPDETPKALLVRMEAVERELLHEEVCRLSPCALNETMSPLPLSLLLFSLVRSVTPCLLPPSLLSSPPPIPSSLTTVPLPPFLQAAGAVTKPQPHQ